MKCQKMASFDCLSGNMIDPGLRVRFGLAFLLMFLGSSMSGRVLTVIQFIPGVMWHVIQSVCVNTETLTQTRPANSMFESINGLEIVGHS